MGRALRGVAREDYCAGRSDRPRLLCGRARGAKGFPRFTDPRLRGPGRYADYLREATERSLERCGVEAFDLLLLHNPDRTGYTHEAVWKAMAALRDAGLTRTLGVAPGPANGFTLDLIDCLERFPGVIDWAMVILNPLEPWPGELVLPAAREAGVRVIARVVDYGGLFHDDVLEGPGVPRATIALPARGLDRRGRERMDAHAPYRPPPWPDAAAARLHWDLAIGRSRRRPDADGGVRAPRKSIEDQRADLAAAPPRPVLSPEESPRSARWATTPADDAEGGGPGPRGRAGPDRWSLTTI